MKRASALGLMLAAAVLALPVSPAAAESRIAKVEVQFPKGQSGTTLQGSIHGDGVVDYRLRARAGQGLNVKISGGKATPYFNVLPPGRSAEAIFIGSRDGDAASLTLPADGEYTIRVYRKGVHVRPRACCE